MKTFAQRAYTIIRRIPRGRVVSYGAIAAMLGTPRAARAVGQALRVLPDDTDVPWWRVINSRGEISLRGISNIDRLQRTLLQREGVRFDRAGRIDWNRYGWEGDGE